MAARRSIFLINPNTTQSITDGLKPLVEKLGYTGTEYTYFTAPTGLPSIDSEADAEATTAPILALFDDPRRSDLLKHDAYLICCYSRHPLVGRLQRKLDGRGGRRKVVTGIFEASVGVALQIAGACGRSGGERGGGGFGIVTTGKVWERDLTDGMVALLGPGVGESGEGCFRGVASTGLNAAELHEQPAEEVRRRLKMATKTLLEKGGVVAICLGCAGMAGLDGVVREACVEALGEEEGKRVRIVDGVQAGISYLEGMLRAGM